LNNRYKYIDEVKRPVNNITKTVGGRFANQNDEFTAETESRSGNTANRSPRIYSFNYMLSFDKKMHVSIYVLYLIFKPNIQK